MQIAAEAARSLGGKLDYPSILRAGMNALDETCRSSTIKHCFQDTYVFPLVEDPVLEFKKRGVFAYAHCKEEAVSRSTSERAINASKDSAPTSRSLKEAFDEASLVTEDDTIERRAKA